jgi:hypothetical protein
MPTLGHHAKPSSLVLCFWHAVAVLGGLPILWLLNASSDSASLSKSLGLFWAIAWMAWPLWWPICLVTGPKQVGATLKALLVPSAMWAAVAAFFLWALFQLPIL